MKSSWSAQRVYAYSLDDLAAFYKSCHHRGLRGWWHRRILKSHIPIFVAYGNEIDREVLEQQHRWDANQ